ncbi:hypothetical protein [Microvirga calopogonii]|uniref:hypothetical protein n=1 Tax=Microvirga calopogonii TaxID=2078013 RepID=UPI000E0D4F27|nr:hypothetical protein [Microvirga calopogonii]
MFPQILLDRIMVDPVATLKSSLIIGHLIGLVFGLGTATLLDIFILRFVIPHKVSKDHYDVIHLFSRIVAFGLLLLWITGLGFLVFYSYFDPIKLSNQKVWAKLIVVSVLTLNGIFIHRTVLPLIHDHIGRPLFDGLGPSQRFLLLTSGAISGTSWYVPFVLGAFPQFNFLPALPLVLTYLFVLAATIVTTQIFTLAVTPSEPTRTSTRAEDTDRKPLASFSGGDPAVLTSQV